MPGPARSALESGGPSVGMLWVSFCHQVPPPFARGANWLAGRSRTEEEMTEKRPGEIKAGPDGACDLNLGGCSYEAPSPRGLWEGSLLRRLLASPSLAAGPRDPEPLAFAARRRGSLQLGCGAGRAAFGEGAETFHQTAVAKKPGEGRVDADCGPCSPPNYSLLRKSCELSRGASVRGDGGMGWQMISASLCLFNLLFQDQ